VALAAGSAAVSAYHGYKRNHRSKAWALAWGFAGAALPGVAPAVALGQGFGRSGSLPKVSPDWYRGQFAEARATRRHFKTIGSVEVQDRDGRTYRLVVRQRPEDPRYAKYDDEWRWELLRGKAVAATGHLTQNTRERRRNKPFAYVTSAVFRPRYRGRGLYRVVLLRLRRIVGMPIESDRTMTQGTVRAWKATGAELVHRGGDPVFRINPRRRRRGA
jgi:hypothetical protein